MSKLIQILSFFIIFIFLVGAVSASTLYVDKTHYKTIQSAVNAAKSGDAIKVANGSYTENVKITKRLCLYGTGYPRVYGMHLFETGQCTINGFTFTRYGFGGDYAGGTNYIRNNYFNNCGILFNGIISSDNIIMNNKITNGTIYIFDCNNNTITGSTVSKSKYGVFLGYSGDAKVIYNKFQYNDIGVYRQNGIGYLNYNTYTGNKINIKNEYS